MNFKKWSLQLVPPLFLLLLIFIPFDRVTSIVWMIAAIPVLISAISIVIKLIRLIRYKYKKQLDQVLSLRDKFIRPTLTIAVFVVAIIVVNLSQRSADDYAIKLSKSIQNECNANNFCPQTITEWQDSSSRPSMRYGRYGTKYTIYYRLSDNKKDFTLVVRHNIDEGFEITGGVEKPLKTHLWNANGLSVDNILE